MIATAFDRYGGFAAVRKVTMDFYDRVLDSDLIGDFFDGVDLVKLVDHQTKFMCQALGGPASYTDRQLHQLHAHLDIGPAHFAEMTRILRETLEDHGFAPEDVEHVVGEVERRAPHVVTRPDLAAAPGAGGATQ